ncbi:hypothetical protein HYH03_016519 [Edaphochlamys debaryana]|uniref:Uncharacterized protein n=1 Tax=Edaphochlamys debaryana TaxID=47281 RepID=A0A836BQ24_9CHLO|nr:hypothetical protein HYH03_016519 [Edaphochlamys debaryana]|eukprot:KAG2484690.1 hypothetical protein HYH03_016519 [Edaphochlamys debaryana]
MLDAALRRHDERRAKSRNPNGDVADRGVEATRDRGLSGACATGKASTEPADSQQSTAAGLGREALVAGSRSLGSVRPAKRLRGPLPSANPAPPLAPLQQPPPPAIAHPSSCARPQRAAGCGGAPLLPLTSRATSVPGLAGASCSAIALGPCPSVPGAWPLLPGGMDVSTPVPATCYGWMASPAAFQLPAPPPPSQPMAPLPAVMPAQPQPLQPLQPPALSGSPSCSSFFTAAAPASSMQRAQSVNSIQLLPASPASPGGSPTASAFAVAPPAGVANFPARSAGGMPLGLDGWSPFGPALGSPVDGWSPKPAAAAVLLPSLPELLAAEESSRQRPSTHG